MVNINVIISEIKRLSEAKEKLRVHAIQFFWTNNAKWAELMRQRNDIWSKEDILRDKLLTLELIKFKQNQIFQLYIEEDKLQEYIRSLDNVIYETTKEEYHDLHIALEELSKIKKEKEALEWELMSEDKRAETREMYIISAMKINGFL